MAEGTEYVSVTEYTKLLNVVKVMQSRDSRAVLACFIAYFCAILTPHITHVLYIREVYSVVCSFVILATMYNAQNLCIVMVGVVANFAVTWMPVKKKHIKAKIAVCVNSGLVCMAYVLRDTTDNNVFDALLCVCMKGVYASIEYIPQSNGIAKYIGYMFFVPGIRYGPVMSYAEYERWCTIGYEYALEGIDTHKANSTAQQHTSRSTNSTDDEENERMRIQREAEQDKKEDMILTEYNRMLAMSMAKISICIPYMVAYRQMHIYTANMYEHVPVYYSIPAMALFCTVEKCMAIVKWWTEDAMYKAAFIDTMCNVNIARLEQTADLSEMYHAWNTRGARFVHTVVHALRNSKEGIKQSTEHKEKEKSKRDSIGAATYIITCVLSYSHFIMFPPLLLSLFLFTLLFLCMPVIPDTLFAHNSAYTYVLHWIICKVLFMYTAATFCCEFATYTCTIRHFFGMLFVLCTVYMFTRIKRAADKNSSIKKRE